ncbi:hypothetical protein HIM_04429 [Hirsutella minnesotensis 3608]|uniref:Uncharacterized protein n=1 Tax=Hirsutella minnesotensis 3608 TaxID=1043627 RepID=A0A0F8A1N0_9HYPO|nr:hypothetical protein HIM_04429 [Hirsutella minnesotensis 3608]
MSKFLLHNKLRSLDSAAREEGNFLLAAQHQSAAESFRRQVWSQKETIAALTRHHLGLHRNDSCTVLPPDTWIQGGFNLCALVEVESGNLKRRVVFRCPMPHKLAERSYPGTINEKVGCEAAMCGCARTVPIFASPISWRLAFQTALMLVNSRLQCSLFASG